VERQEEGGDDGGMEIRRVSAEERPVVTFPLQQYAFNGTPDTEDDDLAQYVPYNRDTVALAAVEGGETLAVAAAIPMRQNVRGLVLPMAGVASVTSSPVARRRGLVRELMGRLLPAMVEQGCVVSALYPFRPSFYERFGYVGVPQGRKVTFAPEGLAPLVKAAVPGSVVWEPMARGFAELRKFSVGLLGGRHGFAVFPDSRAEMMRDHSETWVVCARDADGRTVGAASYRITEYGGELACETFLYDGVVGRTLLLQYFARHVDQVRTVSVPVAPDELPELWGTDLTVEAVGRVALPGRTGPMVRVLDLPACAGMAVGVGRMVVQVEDPYVGGRWALGGEGGRLTVERTSSEPDATMGAAGLSALLYGVLQPEELAWRGLGAAPASGLFPRAVPYLWAKF
jgi:predicted N-acetyltransferase YhbS